MLNKGNGHMKMCINMYCFLFTVFISGCNAIINYYNEYVHRKGTNLCRDIHVVIVHDFLG